MSIIDAPPPDIRSGGVPQGSLWKVILTNSATLGLANGVSLTVGLIATSLIAKSLGPVPFGSYSLAIAVAGFFLTFCRFGTDSILTREVAQRPQDTARIVAGCFSLRISLCAVAVVGMLVLPALFISKPEVVLAIRVAAFYVIGCGFSTLCDAYFQAKLNVLIPSCIKMGVRLFFLACLYFIGSSRLLPTVEITVVAELLGALAGILILRRWVRFSLQLDFTTLKYLFRESIPLALTTAAVMTYLRIDVLLLAYFSSPSSVGAYSGATRLTEVVGGVSSVLGIAVLPVFSRLIGVRQNVQSERVYYHAILGLMAVLVPSCVWFTVFANPIVSAMLGPGYLAAVPALRILVWAQLFAAVGVVYSNYGVADKRQNLILVISRFRCR